MFSSTTKYDAKNIDDAAKISCRKVDLEDGIIIST